MKTFCRRLHPGIRTKFYLRALIITVVLMAAPALLPDQFVWQTKAANPLLRWEANGGAAGGYLYQFSGFYTLKPSILATTQCDAYNAATDKWTTLTPIPQAVTHCGQVADIDNSNKQVFWLAGGFLGDHPGPTTAQVWKYNINNNTWASGPPLPAPRAGGALVKLGRELHYFGGTIRTNNFWTDYGTHWVLNLDTDTQWRTTNANGQLLAPMPNPRNHMGGVALNGKIYAIGGQHKGKQSAEPQDEIDVYDPATNTWTPAQPMPRPIGHVTANVLAWNGTVIVVSGVTTNSLQIANVIAYDPASNSWSELPPLPGARQSPVTGLINNQIVVTCGILATTIYDQTWISSTSAGSSGTWRAGPSLPIAVGEVSSGVINNKLYVLGGDTSATMSYTLATGSWRADLAQRPILGDHHAAEVINGKLYLFGGLNGAGAAAGKVQIYNPVNNSWSLGNPAPYAAGSVATALIGGKVYMAGGIEGSHTVATAAVYNPTTDTWASIAPMPAKRNHAAAGTDGQKLYVFGGRTGGNVVSIGYDDVQIYNPATDTWQWSGQSGSGIPRLPQKRGGMGKAVFYNGEFYVMGGETTNSGTGQVAGNVYNRVDVYNPVTKTWHLDTTMPTARHGIFPVLAGNEILVAGGGVHSAHSFSSVFEIFTPR